MKKNLLLTFAIAFCLTDFSSAQPIFCNAAGNVIIYSNYDGGQLTINVDQNIPNLKIGIVSYEFARIAITGPYAGNVTAVRWAGYNGTNNNCNIALPYTTAITGVPNNVDTIIVMPTANYSNSNGYGLIICNYSCDISSYQGGCNTPDQIVSYFMTAFGTTTTSLYYHHTQYGCWSGTYNVSGGGNCCLVPLSIPNSTGNLEESGFIVSPNPSSGEFHLTLPEGVVTGELKIFNVLGEEIKSIEIFGPMNISLKGENPGLYILNFTSQNVNCSRKLLLEE